MCIAIMNRSGLLSIEVFQNSAEVNNDGMGYAYAANGKIQIVKELNYKKVKKFYESYERDRLANPDSIFLIHFRIATHGKKDLKNCHPFLLKKHNIAVVHNGVITAFGDDNVSDTWEFAYICNQFRAGFLNNPRLREGLGNIIGTGNKVLFLEATGHVTIYGEDLGHYDNAKNNWFSNTSYLDKVYAVSAWERDYGGWGKYDREYKDTLLPTVTDLLDSRNPTKIITCDLCGKDIRGDDFVYIKYPHVCLECVRRIFEIPEYRNSAKNKTSPLRFYEDYCVNCKGTLSKSEEAFGMCDDCREEAKEYFKWKSNSGYVDSKEVGWCPACGTQTYNKKLCNLCDGHICEVCYIEELETKEQRLRGMCDACYSVMQEESTQFDKTSIAFGHKGGVVYFTPRASDILNLFKEDIEKVEAVVALGKTGEREIHFYTDEKELPKAIVDKIIGNVSIGSLTEMPADKLVQCQEVVKDLVDAIDVDTIVKDLDKEELLKGGK